ncbi:MAG: hypothetical protein KBF66_13550 [Rhodoferax sp.]|uniref:hypothetical protein n=1 Tax=Rhodoferax sp. TaxID=50421 RepID=UPI001B6191EF|nr:hypothetical protein [Rhodoferax sp.]MBP9906581.1 hypothetical protein [Rhodoferax sp.]
METVIQIKERDAIPVRALPWLTDWWFGAQEVAEALTHDKENYPEFSRMQAYRQRGDIVEPVSGREWRNTVTYAIQTISDKDLPADQWRRDATAALPAGVFVWRDEWETAYNQSPDGPGIMTAQRSDLMASMPHAALDMTPDELQRWHQCVPGFLPDALNNLKPDEFPAFDDEDSQDIEDRTLNFAPAVSPDLVRLVVEGFATPDDVQHFATPLPIIPKARRNDLDPIIEKAQRESGEKFDTAAVWLSLCEFAGKKVYPLIGIDGQSIQWRIDSLDVPNEFTKRMLKDRLQRQKKALAQSQK